MTLLIFRPRSRSQTNLSCCAFLSIRIKVTALPFVIPSEAEFPATLLRDTAACAVFRRRKPHEDRQRHQLQQEIRQAEGSAVSAGPRRAFLKGTGFSPYMDT